MRPTHRQRFRQCLVLGGLVLALLPASAARGQDSQARPAIAPHVRPIGSRAAYTLERGLALSPTLRNLVDQLEHSDLIVYIAEDRRRAGHSDASIQFIGAASGFRFVRVTVTISLGLPQRVALLGHELQHALEVAANPEIRDRDSFLRYYEQFGKDVHWLAFDSAAALETGERIRRECVLAANIR